MRRFQRDRIYRLVLSLSTITVLAGCGEGDQAPAPSAEPPAAVAEPAPDLLPPEQSEPTPTEASATNETSAVGDDVPAGASGASLLLLDTSGLQSQLENPDLRILDVRSSADYEKSHIPGAVHVDVNAWKNLALSEGGLHEQAAWSEKVGGLGISSDSLVVVYASNPTDATRIWWTLKYVGVPSVAVLDGGWNVWEQAAGATTSDVPQVEPTEFETKFQSDRLVEIGTLKEAVEKKDVNVVDTRSLPEFEGTGGRGARKGHIPDATHLEWKDLLGEDGRFKSRAELQQIFAERELAREKTTVTYCQTGGRASLDAFALELAGYENVKLYYCSWQEWSADSKAPVVSPVPEKAADEKPADEKPADEKPADEKPAEEKPAEEKPAEEKPVEEKPLEEKPLEEKPLEEKADTDKP